MILFSGRSTVIGLLLLCLVISSTGARIGERSPELDSIDPGADWGPDMQSGSLTVRVGEPFVLDTRIVNGEEGVPDRAVELEEKEPGSSEYVTIESGVTDEDGWWRVTLTRYEPGVYYYRFTLDGEWHPDKDAPDSDYDRDVTVNEEPPTFTPTTTADTPTPTPSPMMETPEVPSGPSGIGTFSIKQEGSVDVGQIGTATLYLDSTWDPKADDVWLHLSWDPAVIEYIDTKWKVGNSVSATLEGTSSLFLQMADFANDYPNGRVALAGINLKALAQGSTPLTITVDHVRAHDDTGELDPSLSPPGELTATANPGTFVVGGAQRPPEPPPQPPKPPGLPQGPGSDIEPPEPPPKPNETRMKIPFGETMTGTITADQRYDLYNVSADAGDHILVGMVALSGALAPKLTGYSPSYAEEDTKTKHGEKETWITVVARVNGTYTIRAADYGNSKTGDYAIFAQRLNAPVKADPVNPGTAVEGSITKPGEIRSYTVAGTTGMQADFRVRKTGGDFWPQLWLFTPNIDEGERQDDVNEVIMSKTLPRNGLCLLLVRDGYPGRRTGQFQLLITGPTSGGPASGNSLTNISTAIQPSAMSGSVTTTSTINVTTALPRTTDRGSFADLLPFLMVFLLGVAVVGAVAFASYRWGARVAKTTASPPSPGAGAHSSAGCSPSFERSEVDAAPIPVPVALARPDDAFYQALARIQSDEPVSDSELSTLERALAEGAKIGGGAAIVPMIGAVDGETSQIAALVARVLVATGARAVDPLVDLLWSDTRSEVRCWSVKTLGELGDDRAMPALLEAARDPDETLAFWANESLKRLEKREG